MSKRESSRQSGKNAFELIEEAIHLLRSAAGSVLAIYYAGTLPFVLAALYFLGDMSRSPFAAQHLVGGALALAFTFLWMKTWQATFSRRMYCLISGEKGTLSVARLWRVFLAQAAVQPLGLVVLPLSIVVAFPFPWIYAFYQNLAVLDDGDRLDIGGLRKKAWTQALLWPIENQFMLAIMSIFGFFICLNLMTFCFVLPGLVKMLFGIETVFTRSSLSLLNSTFIAAALGLSYLCIDPILKTIYALRCFYGEARRSGADLKEELRQSSVTRLGVMLLPILIGLLGFQGTDLLAQEQVPSEPDRTSAVVVSEHVPVSSSVSAAELDHSIQQVIQQPKYAWREPRKMLVEDASKDKGFFERLLDRIKPFLISCLKTIGRWLDALIRWLFGRSRTSQSDDAASRWVVFMHLLVYGLIIATAALLFWMFYRVWMNRRQKPGTIASEPVRPMPDLSDENLRPDELPEESWTNLAQKLLANGELRLALRAFYLASLAQLAGKNLIQIARFKSNSDYEFELRRRAHALPGLLAAFGENLSVFDRVWYGMHEANRDMVNKFAENVERMRGAGTVSVPVSGAA